MPETFYSTGCSGIGGQMKRRYADFIVEEITKEGRTCKVEHFGGEFPEGKEMEVPPNPKDKEQLQLDMEKINKDLNFCVSKLSRFIQCSRKRFGYAGMKDKRAVTCQRISIYRPDVTRLGKFRSMGIRLRNPEWSDERIEIGNLKGNKFTIKIRDIGLEEKEIKKRLKACFGEIKKNGIANFFGEQRFGGIRKITHLVGREFIKGNPEGAIMLYLTATAPQEDEELKKARAELAKTYDFSQASKAFPVKYRYERALIHHLCRYPKDYVGAFRALPKALRYLFTHAYQSHIFNKVIEKRIENGWGLKKVEGDILLDGKSAAPLFGFETELAKGEAGRVEKEALEAEGIELTQFKVKEMPELSSKGTRREIVLNPTSLKLEETGKDEFFPERKFAKISFELPKGCYATTVLREIMKVEL